MSSQFRFIQPMDVVNFRGNQSFGEAGERGESDMPPQPSIFAGALRSYWLAHEQIDLGKFKHAIQLENPLLNAQLGTPSKPGSFRLKQVWLAKRSNSTVEYFMPLPSDVLALESGIKTLQPQSLPKGLASSSTSPMHALLKAKAEKPKVGCWLNTQGIKAYMRGEKLLPAHVEQSSHLWATDERLGIALHNGTRTAEDGKLYTTESIALKEGVGFVAEITGAENYPQQGTLRLGGDGRGASMQTIDGVNYEPDWKNIETSKKFKIWLTTPALFLQGWQLPDTHNHQVKIGDGTATLACAAVNRFSVVSGWDLAKWQPKDAQRVTPAGSVYWLENYTGSIASLQRLMDTGIGVDTIDHGSKNTGRKAEGYNNFMIANWN